jgi:hypothetical protein
VSPSIRVFLSHHHSDARFAARLALLLKEHGLSVWYAPHAIRGAQEWEREISTALRRCNWFLLVLSPRAIRSEWIYRELLFALNTKRYNRRITPVMYRSCDPARLSFALVGIQRVSFLRGAAAGFRDLLAVWGRKLKARRSRIRRQPR